MGRSQLVKMTCDFCTTEETFDLTTGDPRIMQSKLKKWLGVVPALAPAGPNAPDMTKWYDSPDCITRGLKKDEEVERMESAVAASA